MSTFLGSLVARAVASTVLADETFVTVAGVRYRTDATNADTVVQDEDGTRTYRKTIRVPAEDFPVPLSAGVKVEYGGAVYRAIYAMPLEDVWELGLTAFGGAYARP